MPTTLLLFIAGIVLLIAGAEAIVRGASRLAALVGISPLVIGLTVVALGTSSPELAVSIRAAASGQTDIALGNVVGSNICNVLLILGLSALISPLIVAQQLVRLDVPLMVGISIVTFLLALDGGISRVEGSLFLVAAVAYTTFVVRQSMTETAVVQAEYDQFRSAPRARFGWLLEVAFVVAGLAMLMTGSRWLVDGAVAAATALGVSELIVGLTVVAVGTSLPEVATSVIASIRGERDIAVGNIVGSNIFNILAILGAGALVSAEGIAVSTAALRFDIPVMVAVAVACLPIFFTGYCIERWEGGLFLGYYVAYTLYLVLDATRHDALTGYGLAMTYFVLPLTGVTLIVLVLRGGRRQPHTA